MKFLTSVINVFAWIIWYMDITNAPCMERLDTIYPLNGLFWFLVFCLWCWAFVEVNPSEKSENANENEGKKK